MQYEHAINVGSDRNFFSYEIDRKMKEKNAMF